MKTILLALLFLILSTSVSFAKETPTDPFSGEPIEWDTEEIAGEDGAGLETDSYYNRYETKPVIDDPKIDSQIVETEETEDTMQRVTVCLGGTSGSFNDPDILLTMYQDGFHKKEIILRARDGFYTEEDMPLGKYTFGKAESEDGRTYKAEPSTFMVTEEKPVVITLRPGTGEILYEKAQESLSEMQEATTPEEEKEHNIVLLVAIIIASTYLGSSFLSLFNHKKKGGHIS